MFLGPRKVTGLFPAFRELACYYIYVNIYKKRYFLTIMKITIIDFTNNNGLCLQVIGVVFFFKLGHNYKTRACQCSLANKLMENLF